MSEPVKALAVYELSAADTDKITAILQRIFQEVGRHSLNILQVSTLAVNFAGTMCRHPAIKEAAALLTLEQWQKTVLISLMKGWGIDPMQFAIELAAVKEMGKIQL
jgi:hypothetical protein